MHIPDFSIHNLIPEHPSDADAFQHFTCDLLKKEYPGLDRFPTVGKDGCIDFSHTTTSGRTVGECKYSKDNDIETARKAWADVYSKLQEHLNSPEGPTTGQSQYRPWYKTDSAINKYLFCISIELKNQSQVDTLEEEITSNFLELARKHSHLEHLKEIDVTVLHWGRLSERLKDEPALFFRWFKDSRIPGLEPLISPSRQTGFRAYLYDEKLTYYSRTRHFASYPSHEGEIPDEETLLSYLETGKEKGFVLTGGGGLGKSRLAIQLARMAEERGWVVFRVRRIETNTVERIARIVGSNKPTVLLFDYIEIQKDFSQVIEDIIEFNDLYNCRLGFIACCRTSYYYSAVKGHLPHKMVDLSDEGDWAELYRSHAVRHILTSAGLPAEEKYIGVCHNIPVLAVFMAYLYSSDRKAELEDLIHTADFGAWITKRVEASFRGNERERDLAILSSFFPMPKEVATHIDRKRLRPIFDILAQDEWIEEQPWDETCEGPAWCSVHDVVADGILLNYTEIIEKTIDIFISELLETAQKNNCLRPALLALQRISGEKVFIKTDWPSLFITQMDAAPTDWREVRDITLRFSALSAKEQINLLSNKSGVWEGAKGDVKIQNRLGWLARWAAKEGENELTADELAHLKEWVVASAKSVSRSNFILTCGLQLFPDEISQLALKWINLYPHTFQAHYLIVAWLRNGYPPEEVSLAVSRWCLKNGETSHFSFIARAWLEANGCKRVIEPTLRQWLNVSENRAAWVAEFVYSSWLNAGGDKDVVEEGIKAWLAVPENRTDLQAGFVYKSWLGAGGDKDVVEEGIKAWLAVPENRADMEAQFVYKSWLDADGDKDVVEEGIKAWLAVPENRTDLQAGFVYKPWLDADGDKDVVEEGIKAWLTVPENRINLEGNYVFCSWLFADGNKTLVRDAISEWLEVHSDHFEADYIYRAWLKSGGEFSLVAEPAMRWLHANRERPEAVFLTKPLAKEKDIPDSTVCDILHWCRTFPGNPDTFWRLNQLDKKLLRKEIVEEFCKTGEVVIGHMIESEKTYSITAFNHAALMICYLLFLSNHKTDIKERVNHLFLRWLRYPTSYRTEEPFAKAQEKTCILRLAELLESGELDIEKDRATLERFLCWLNMWHPDNKVLIEHTLRYLGKTFPAEGLWEIVQ